MYHKDKNGEWIQEDSHHSNPDGSFNMTNLYRDTKSEPSVDFRPLLLFR
ncbi:hypothetical protein [Vibrio panuliri]|nr:hypothetical protein [Vibrio panuliri]